VEVRHALTHHVVHRNETPWRFERLRNHVRKPANTFEQWPDLVGTQLGQRHDVPPGNHQHMPGEQRGAVEERDGDLVVEHPVRRCEPGHNLAEGAYRHET